jgi:hypothetical protein
LEVRSVIPLQSLSRERHGAIFEYRDVLIEHLDDRVVPIVSHPRQSRRNRAFRTLTMCGLIEYWPKEQPEYTRMTERGRWELARMLADYAEVLTRIAIMRTDQLAASVGLDQFPEMRPKPVNRGSVLIPRSERIEGTDPENSLGLKQLPTHFVDVPLVTSDRDKGAAVIQHRQKA